MNDFKKMESIIGEDKINFIKKLVKDRVFISIEEVDGAKNICINLPNDFYPYNFDMGGYEEYVGEELDLINDYDEFVEETVNELNTREFLEMLKKHGIIDYYTYSVSKCYQKYFYLIRAKVKSLNNKVDIEDTTSITKYLDDKRKQYYEILLNKEFEEHKNGLIFNEDTIKILNDSDF